MLFVVFVLTSAGVCIGAPAAAAAPPVNSAGHCLTPAVANEPPCNPFVAGPAWSTTHRNSYAQGSSPYPAPHPGDDVIWQDVTFENEIPVIVQFSEPYPDGGITAWFSTIAVPQDRIYKLDYESGEVLGSATVPGEPGPPTTSGVYNLLDRDNHLITATEQGLLVYGDAEPGVRTSGIELLAQFTLPPQAMCRPDDRIIGMTMTYEGTIAFATVQGIIGVIPREPNRMSAEHLVTASINGKACGDPSVPKGELEEISNSISTDEEGGIYPVSTEAQYKFRLSDSGLERVWRAEYEAGGAGGGSTLSAGSGSTPDVVGTEPGKDKLIVITDGQRQNHVVMFWRDEIPRDWKPIEPGKDRRIACEVPITFGDPSTTEAKSEQSVLTRGYSAVVVNNVLALDEALAAVPPPYNVLAQLLGNVPGNAPMGIERIDWDPRTRTCKSVWGNPEVSIPNSIPTMSTESGLVYGAGVRDGVWGLSGIDFMTGEEVLFVPTSPSPTENSFFAATTVGPGGDIWVGGTSGLSVFRGPERPEPQLACKDISEPSSRVRSRRIGSGGAAIRGAARDLACGLPARVKRVEVSVARVAGGARSAQRRKACRYLRRNGALGRPRSCAKPRFLRARLANGSKAMRRFALVTGRELPEGRYRVVVRATDSAGLVEGRPSGP